MGWYRMRRREREREDGTQRKKVRRYGYLNGA